MDTLLGWTLVGLAVVILLRYVLRVEQPLGSVTTLALGVTGAIAGGFVSQFVDMGFVRSIGRIDWVSIVSTVFSAVALVLAVGIWRRAARTGFFSAAVCGGANFPATLWQPLPGVLRLSLGVSPAFFPVPHLVGLVFLWT